MGDSAVLDYVNELKSFNIEDLKQFALNGWELGRIHGISHWLRVERNGILLSSEYSNGILLFRKDVNVKVVRCFAYLHDKCRMSDGSDLEHGPRAAKMIHSIRETLLKELNNEEFTLLEDACRLHTMKHRTGNPTIDACFDADRLDLGRVGIVPHPKKMATPQGADYAIHSQKFRVHAQYLQELHNF